MPTMQTRPAIESDQSTIKALVSSEQLDPSSLHWSHFVIAESDGLVAGIGQIRPYPGCRELGSLVVKKEFREQGVGAMIVNALLEKETEDVYLECESYRESYYARFGFVRIPWYQSPYTLNLKALLVGMVSRLVYKVQMIVMKRTA